MTGRVEVLKVLLIAAALAAMDVDATGGQTFSEFPIPTPNSHPLRITLGPDGNLWFTETSGNRIGRIDAAGVIREFPLPMARAGPAGIATAFGAMWFVEGLANQVGRILGDGTLREFPVPARFFNPGAIALAADGYLWIAGGGGIGRVSPSGSTVVYNIATEGRIGDIARGPRGTVCFTDNSGSIHCIPRNGGKRRRFPAYRPDQLAEAPNGDLWFTMVDGDGVGRMTPTGEIEVFQLSGSAPEDLVVDKAANVWVTDWIGNAIIKLVPHGATSRYSIPTAKARPIGIALGRDETVWFVERDANKIGRLSFGKAGP